MMLRQLAPHSLSSRASENWSHGHAPQSLEDAGSYWSWHRQGGPSPRRTPDGTGRSGVVEASAPAQPWRLQPACGGTFTGLRQLYVMSARRTYPDNEYKRQLDGAAACAKQRRHSVEYADGPGLALQALIVGAGCLTGQRWRILGGHDVMNRDAVTQR